METELEEKMSNNQLEELLNYRNSRLFGQNIKNMTTAKIVYNEVLPEKCCTNAAGTKKTQEKQEKIIMHGGNVQCNCNKDEKTPEQPIPAPAFNGFADFCANYAAKMLNHANGSLNPVTEENPQNCSQNNTMTNAQIIKNMIQQEKQTGCGCQNHGMPDNKQISDPMPCTKTPVHNQIQCNPMQNDLAYCQNTEQQLNRMEQMIREMYLTNQELYKCILNYCKTYLMN